MSEPAVSSGNLFLIPLSPHLGDRSRFDRLGEFLADHPAWFSIPADRETIKLSSFMVLSDPANLVWEVWRGGEFVGILSLTKVTPRVDALIHFVFMDATGNSVVGKRQLMRRWLRHCFDDLGFQRLTAEAPEPFGRLIRFYRNHLGFRFEGEDRAKQLVESLPQSFTPGQRNLVRDKVVAAVRQGSRREGCHWHQGQWTDVVTLRLLAHEFRAFDPEGQTREA